MTEEQKEKNYLNDLLEKIEKRLAHINGAIQGKKEEINYMNNHMQEHKRDMDHLEKNAMRETIHNYTLQGDHSVENKKRLYRLRDTAYFGRIDFKREDDQKFEPIYVGVHNFQDTDEERTMVYDWRAPISSLFYDYELGEVAYESNSGKVRGEISLKRQFRIREGQMEYMLDTDVTLLDDVLQRELNRASSNKMRNIVATIQKEQNEIIRNEEARHLVIQGVAGSGKTSVALHRIAFLLYRFKDTISSEDILIISPNKVFASYIANVLPELGEESVAETSMEEIANELLAYQIKFQSFFDQVAELLSKHDEKLIERITFKSAPSFLKKVDEYLVYLNNEGFQPEDIYVMNKTVPAWFIKKSFEKYHRVPLLQRFNKVVEDIVEFVFQYYHKEVQGKDRTQLHSTIRKMFPSTNLRTLYKGFYGWLGRPDLLKLRRGSVYEYSDVFPLIYLKMKLEGIRLDNRVKHLVIDEMQDYSAVQYKVLSTLYPCKKTIMGDINQSVNPFSASNLETINGVYPDAHAVKMMKSYRSTYDITEFTKRISHKVEVEAIERRGEEPAILAAENPDGEIEQIKKLINQFEHSSYNTLGIICKLQPEADRLHELLKENFKIKLLNAISVAFGIGIVITTAHLAKGLEFDQVIVPHCTAGNYKNAPDRQMLYVACTRAMHKLCITYTGEKSAFIA